MKIIAVASKNPVKIRAAREGFTRMFPTESFELLPVSVLSGVDDQPYTSQQTLQGAFNRAQGAKAQHPQADYWVGIEGGVEEAPETDLLAGELCAFAWVVVLSNDQIGKGRTGTLFLPRRVAELVRQGKELGEADDIVFGRSNSKQENGAVGLLTGDVMDRAAFYIHAIILALVPFKNTALYPLESRPQL
jgi:inosine/xanthosine triphosphatase